MKRLQGIILVLILVSARQSSGYKITKNGSSKTMINDKIYEGGSGSTVSLEHNGFQATEITCISGNGGQESKGSISPADLENDNDLGNKTGKARLWAIIVGVIIGLLCLVGCVVTLYGGVCKQKKKEKNRPNSTIRAGQQHPSHAPYLDSDANRFINTANNQRQQQGFQTINIPINPQAYNQNLQQNNQPARFHQQPHQLNHVPQQATLPQGFSNNNIRSPVQQAPLPQGFSNTNNIRPPANQAPLPPGFLNNHNAPRQLAPLPPGFQTN